MEAQSVDKLCSVSLHLQMLYSGTRIVYERTMLMHLRNSPMAQTPPKNLASIPEFLVKGHEFAELPKENGLDTLSPIKKGKGRKICYSSAVVRFVFNL